MEDLKPISLKVPVKTLEAIDAAAKLAGMSRTAFMLHAALQPRTSTSSVATAEAIQETASRKFAKLHPVGTRQPSYERDPKSNANILRGHYVLERHTSEGHEVWKYEERKS
jgi:hypothetical protein